MRPGRFDRVVKVELPDVEGRVEILKAKARKLPASPSLDFRVLANLTPGMSGAEIEGIANEAAIRAVQRVRRSTAAGEIGVATEVTMVDFEEAIRGFLGGRMRLQGGLGGKFMDSLLKVK